jgi:hypothetical protein
VFPNFSKICSICKFNFRKIACKFNFHKFIHFVRAANLFVGFLLFKIYSFVSLASRIYRIIYFTYFIYFICVIVYLNVKLNLKSFNIIFEFIKSYIIYFCIVNNISYPFLYCSKITCQTFAWAFKICSTTFC